MTNMGVLVPSIVSLKDVVAAVTNIDEMLSDEGNKDEVSAADYMRQWLSDEKAN